MILAGIDEAGYGPTLGPLVVSIAVIRVPDPPAPDPATQADSDAPPPAGPPPDLWEMLSEAVSRRPEARKIPVDDSKKLYSSGRGLRALEEGVLPFLCARGTPLPRDLRSLLGQVVIGGEEAASRSLEEYPWYRGRDVSLPCDTYAAAIQSRTEALTGELERAGAEVRGLVAAPIDAGELNRALASEGNKAVVSFGAISRFLRGLWERYPGECVDVWVDRQGGRVRYARQVFEAVQPKSVKIDSEGPDGSVYELKRSGKASEAGTFRVRFVREAESVCLPVALASMLSKYIRELHMRMFNEFWGEHVDGLKPTAGYAVDARRFLEDIAAARQRLEVPDPILIRQR